MHVREGEKKKPSADRVAQNLEIISNQLQLGTSSTRIVMKFIISTLLLTGTNRKDHGQNSGTLTKFEKSSQDSVPPYL